MNSRKTTGIVWRKPLNKLRCSKCRERKPLTAFYRQYNATRGYDYQCKPCRNATVYKYRQKPRVKASKRLQDKRYAATPSGKRVRIEVTKRYQKKFRQKATAHAYVYRALKEGRLIKQPCKVCGSKKQIEAHHPDYSKPLKVIWLCNKHHREIHLKCAETNAPKRHRTRTSRNCARGSSGRVSSVQPSWLN